MSGATVASYKLSAAEQARIREAARQRQARQRWRRRQEERRRLLAAAADVATRFETAAVRVSQLADLTSYDQQHVNGAIAEADLENAALWGELSAQVAAARDRLATARATGLADGLTPLPSGTGQGKQHDARADHRSVADPRLDPDLREAKRLLRTIPIDVDVPAGLYDLVADIQQARRTRRPVLLARLRDRVTELEESHRERCPDEPETPVDDLAALQQAETRARVRDKLMAVFTGMGYHVVDHTVEGDPDEAVLIQPDGATGSFAVELTTTPSDMSIQLVRVIDDEQEQLVSGAGEQTAAALAEASLCEDLDTALARVAGPDLTLTGVNTVAYYPAAGSAAPAVRPTVRRRKRKRIAGKERHLP